MFTPKYRVDATAAPRKPKRGTRTTFAVIATAHVMRAFTVKGRTTLTTIAAVCRHQRQPNSSTAGRRIHRYTPASSATAGS